jgi:hypothetical protein
MPTTSYDVATDVGKVRLLLSDIAAPWVFTNEEIQALLDMEHGSIKRATAQAIDTNATNQALASKVLKDHQITTDGAKLADAMRKHAAALRAQAREEDEDGDGFYFGVVDLLGDDCRPPERTGWPLS